jgi:hypothetical protein
MMSKKRSKVAGSASSQMIRKAVKNFHKMSKERRIDLMVEAKVMTPEQAQRAKQKWAEIQDGDVALQVPEPVDLTKSSRPGR